MAQVLSLSRNSERLIKVRHWVISMVLGGAVGHDRVGGVFLGGKAVFDFVRDEFCRWQRTSVSMGIDIKIEQDNHVALYDDT